MNEREKAAFVMGLVSGFDRYGWPAEMSGSERDSWRRLGRYAVQMLDGGVYNPLDAYRVIQAANEFSPFVAGKSA